MTETEKLKLINGRNEQGQTPLNIAVRRNNFQCVKLLCSAGANVNLADKEGNTPYHIAAKRDHTDCLETLLKVEDRELDKKSFEGDAALHLAVRCNSVESAEMLIRAGANVNKKNDTAGSTPLHLAVLFDNRQLVNHLLIQVRFIVLYLRGQYTENGQQLTCD
ncbi:nuclear factor NF-kappa-B p105 subunit-like [Thrips palmi]|uniref:Nuclear factor NF-kappa-B p105 subunit-like n=1 Tax=Thrips palmi TaxID=161013 RepID=A0A6P8YL07_THRPL|nr:nuclear factor NF-kappa-B p105 subunit-like [Thrips palmi]